MRVFRGLLARAVAPGRHPDLTPDNRATVFGRTPLRRMTVATIRPIGFMGQYRGQKPTRSGDRLVAEAVTQTRSDRSSRYDVRFTIQVGERVAPLRGQTQRRGPRGRAEPDRRIEPPGRRVAHIAKGPKIMAMYSYPHFDYSPPPEIGAPTPLRISNHSRVMGKQFT